MKKLTLDDFKKRAESMDGKKVLSTIKGGLAGPDDCHGCPTLEDKIRAVINDELKGQN
ncbi:MULTISPECIES: hypothetical protein [Chryseobacterium]|uniref:Uncharacterized protein n=1 Tax=Chryseobacterium joostei TaxID=112234 RepID=A0A1N7I1R8_9FLAO|nr:MULTISPECIES: hypothetical protein [Chryseobacterium]SIS30999.1 hypothetical protein SAMN05421768_102166 [Chryseobacterium joostei]SIS47486.1 hypothetical protein SAMN05421768_108165 [Chryseobacterium joostei]